MWKRSPPPSTIPNTELGPKDIVSVTPSASCPDQNRRSGRPGVVSVPTNSRVLPEGVTRVSTPPRKASRCSWTTRTFRMAFAFARIRAI